MMIKIYKNSWLILFGAWFDFMQPMCASAAYTLLVNPGETYNETIDTNRTLTIENHGLINSVINVCTGCDLYVQNTGVFNASINSSGISKVIQVIHGNDDITSLGGTNSGYSVLVDTHNNPSEQLSLSAIVNHTGSANGYEFVQSIQINMDTLSVLDNVHANDKIIVYTDIIPDSDFTLFSNFSGAATVNIISNNLNPLYSMETYFGGNGADLRVRVVRSVDYANVLNNRLGIYLNSLRNANPDDVLIKRIDSAKTIAVFNDVLANSVKVHPIKMMQSIKTVYSHKMLETMHIAHNDSIGIMPIVVFSSGLRAIGGEPYIIFNPLDDLHIKLSANVFSIKYSDDLNSYSATSYGATVDTVYDLPSNNFIRMYGGFNFSSFDAGLVFDGNGGVEKPKGWSGYLTGEFGHRFDFKNKYYISPFAALGGDFASILNTKETTYFVGAGADSGFNFEFDGYRYDYALRVVARTNTNIGTELYASILSLADAAGAGLKFGANYDNIMGVTYHVGLDAHFQF